MIVIEDRLDDAKALSPMLVTVDARHTLRIVLSSESNTEYTINGLDSSIYNYEYFEMRRMPHKSRL